MGKRRSHAWQLHNEVYHHPCKLHNEVCNLKEAVIKLVKHASDFHIHKHHKREWRRLAISSGDRPLSTDMTAERFSARDEQRTPGNRTTKAVTTTANGTAESTEEAIVQVHDLDVSRPLLLDSSLAVSSLGVLCEEG